MLPANDTDVLRTVLHSQVDQIEPDFLRSILHSQLQYLSPEAREAAAVIAAEKLNEALLKAGISKTASLAPKDEARMKLHLQEMQSDGITLLGPVMSEEQIKDVRAHLDTKNAYGGHVWSGSDRVSRPLAELKETHRQASYILEDILLAPHLLETMSNPFVLKLVEEYLGCTPTVFQSNLMWSFQKNSAAPVVAQNFHRDWDNFRFCVLFVYLTDVDEKTGPHQYIRSSHLCKGMQEAVERYQAKATDDTQVKPNIFYQEAVGLDDKYIQQVFEDKVEQIAKPAGFAFLVDAFGLHRGVPLIEGERLLFWTRYGLYDNGFSVDVTPSALPRAPFAGRMPDDKTHRYIFRSVLQSEFTAEVTPSSMHASDEEFEALCYKLLSRHGYRKFVRKSIEVIADRLRGRKRKLPKKINPRF